MAKIRALFVLAILATYSPLGIAIDNAHAHGLHGGFVGFAMFTRRITRFEAAQQFDPTKSAVSRCPSRYVRQAVAAGAGGARVTV